MDIKDQGHASSVPFAQTTQRAGANSGQHTPPITHGGNSVVTIDAVLLRTSTGEPMAGIRTAGLALAVHLTHTAEYSLKQNATEWQSLQNMPRARAAAKMHVNLVNNSADLELSPGIDGNPVLYPINTAEFHNQFEGRLGTTFATFIQSYFPRPPSTAGNAYFG